MPGGSSTQSFKKQKLETCGWNMVERKIEGITLMTQKFQMQFSNYFLFEWDSGEPGDNGNKVHSQQAIWPLSLSFTVCT